MSHDASENLQSFFVWLWHKIHPIAVYFKSESAHASYSTASTHLWPPRLMPLVTNTTPFDRFFLKIANSMVQPNSQTWLYSNLGFKKTRNFGNTRTLQYYFEYCSVRMLPKLHVFFNPRLECQTKLISFGSGSMTLIFSCQYFFNINAKFYLEPYLFYLISTKNLKRWH